jgi:hypothetical protein
VKITDRIDRHAKDRPDCRACGGTGLVCEIHPNLPWDEGDGFGCDCSAPGMECLLIEGEQVELLPLIRVIPLDINGLPTGAPVLIHGTVTFTPKVST